MTRPAPPAPQAGAPGRLATAWRPSGWPLRLKLSLSLMAAALLSAVLVSYLDLRASMAQAVAVEHSDLAGSAQGLALRIDQLLDEQASNVQLLAQDNDVRDYLQHRARGDARLAPFQRALDEQLAIMLRIHGRLSGLSVLDAAGVVIASTEPGLTGQDLSAKDYFRQVQAGQPYTSSLLFGLRGGEPGVYFAAPVRDSGGALRGVAIARLRGSAIDDILASVEAPFTPLLVDNSGIVLSSPQPALRFRSLHPMDPAQAQHLLDAQALPVAQITPLRFDGLERPPVLNAEGIGSQSYRTAEDGAGVAGIAQAADGRWRVYLTAPSERLAQPLRALLLQALLSFGIVMLLLLPAAWLMGRAMGRPILALQAAALRLRRGGDASARQPDSLKAVSQRGDEIGRLARVFQSMADEVLRREASLDQQVRERTQQLAQSHARLDEELRIARALQQSLLPQAFPAGPGYGLHGSMQPAWEMGGDFYDVFVLEDGRCGMLVADVSGKGVPAAFFMAVASTVLQDTARKWAQPGRVLSQANEALQARNPMELFVTVFYALYDPAEGSLRYACAGHNPPLLRDGEGRVSPLPVSHDLPLGAMPGVTYEERCIPLPQDALLLMFSDGVTEAAAADGTPFGDARLHDWLASTPHRQPAQACEALRQLLDQFSAGAPPADDLTLLFLHRPPAPADDSPVQALPSAAGSGRWRLPSRIAALAPLAAQMEALLLQGTPAWPDEDRQALAFQVNLCIEELLTNTIAHGLKGAPDHVLEVELHLQDDGLQLLLRDDAPAYDPFAQAPAPDLDTDLDARQIGGLGVHLVQHFMDECRAHHDGSGNRITLRKHIGPAPGARPHPTP